MQVRSPPRHEQQWEPSRASDVEGQVTQGDRQARGQDDLSGGSKGKAHLGFLTNSLTSKLFPSLCHVAVTVALTAWRAEA